MTGTSSRQDAPGLAWRSIERDTPEILEKYKQGEFPSVRQAAIAAGIVKVPTAFERILKLLPKISEEETKELQSILSEMI
jgi:hypothetical protein